MTEVQVHAVWGLLFCVPALIAALFLYKHTTRIKKLFLKQKKYDEAIKNNKTGNIFEMSNPSENLKDEIDEVGGKNFIWLLVFLVLIVPAIYKASKVYQLSP